MKILVVDDEPDLRFMTEMMLTSLGYDAEFAGDGNTALAAVKSDPPDLVLLDIRMPPPDGWQVLKEIRSRRDLSDTAVVILSAHSSDNTLERAIREGANGFLVKPFGREELQAAVESVTKKSG